MVLSGKLAILAAAVILPLAGGTHGQHNITWGQPVRLAGNANGNVAAVSCPGVTDCIAMDTGGDIVRWDGTRWSPPRPGIRGASGIVSLSCPSAGFCAAAGDTTGGDLWTGHGTTWTRNGPFGSGYQWATVSCVSARFCAAVTVDGDVTTFNGRTWSAPRQIDPTEPLYITMVSCTSATRCFMMGSIPEETELFRWNGTGWTWLKLSQSLDKYASLACAPTGFCMVDDAGSIYVSSSGSEWNMLPGHGPEDSNPVLSCASSKFCMLLGGAYDLYDGTGWRQFILFPITSGYPSLACAGQMCAVVGDAPNSTANIFRSGRWGTETPIDNSGELDSVSCLSSGFCATAGMSWDAVVRRPGQHWGPTVRVSREDGISGVSCTSATFCLLVNESGYSWRYDGTGWVRAPSLADTYPAAGSQAAVSCVRPSFCVSAGTGLSRYNGMGWTTPVQVQFPSWSTVSCSSATFCMAMNPYGDFSVFDGKNWSPPENTGLGQHSWQSVDCLSPHFCAAAGRSFPTGVAEVGTFNGTSWQIDNTLTSSAITMQSVTCTSASFCLALEQTGQVFTFNGTQWSPAGSVLLRLGTLLESVACSSPTSCVAVDSMGDATLGSLSSR